MTKSPLVSVVIPVLNGQEYINMMIDSLINQSHNNLEIIVVDCNSTDHTASILANYKDPRIKYLHIKSRDFREGLSYGFSASRGEFIALSGQMDISLPVRIENQLKFMTKFSDTALTITNFDVIDKNSRIIDFYPDEPKSSLLNQQWLASNPIANGSIMFSRKYKDLEKIISDHFTDLSDNKFWEHLKSTHSCSLIPNREYQLRALNSFETLGSRQFNSKKFKTPNENRILETWLRLSCSTNLNGNNLSQNNQESITSLPDINKLVVHALQNTNLTNTQHLLLSNILEELNKLWGQPKNISNTPPVSVVMSVYNGELFLKHALESILNQSFYNFEFIIIDDGSTDNSAEIVKSLKDKRIRLISQKNHGFIYSLNKAVELARGKLIARMDQDDIAMPERLEKQLQLFDKNSKLGAVSTFFELIDFNEGKPLGKTMIFPINSIDIKRALYLHNPMAHGATTFRKKAWKEAGKYRSEYHPPEDYDLWRRIAKNWDLGMVPEVLFQYRINNPESMSQKNLTNGAENFKNIQREIIDGPFINKSIYRLIKDYREISESIYGKFTAQIKEDYFHMQRNLANLFLKELSVKKAFSATMFVCLLHPLKSAKLMKRFIKILILSISRKMHIR